VDRVVTAQALVAFAGNQYSVPPGLAGSTVTVKHRLGQPVLDSGHVRALETAVLAGFTADRACARKVRRPPSPAALAQAELLRPGPADGRDVVIDLAAWADAARDRKVAP
jgi:hypothetical protein